MRPGTAALHEPLQRHAVDGDHQPRHCGATVRAVQCTPLVVWHEKHAHLSLFDRLPRVQVWSEHWGAGRDAPLLASPAAGVAHRACKTPRGRLEVPVSPHVRRKLHAQAPEPAAALRTPPEKVPPSTVARGRRGMGGAPRGAAFTGRRCLAPNGWRRRTQARHASARCEHGQGVRCGRPNEHHISASGCGHQAGSRGHRTEQQGSRRGCPWPTDRDGEVPSRQQRRRHQHRLALAALSCQHTGGGTAVWPLAERPHLGQ